jgi:hypothetical protein
MKLSPYFNELSSAYAYEIEDLTYDSAGDDVLQARLKDKRSQFGDLLMMAGTDPTMVAPALHGGFRFTTLEVVLQLVAAQPGEFPAWEALAATLEFEPWAEALVRRSLEEPEGDQFLLVAAGLEYILGRLGASMASGAEDRDGQDEDEEEDAGDDDLGDAGEDWLGDQGFDRRN